MSWESRISRLLFNWSYFLDRFVISLSVEHCAWKISCSFLDFSSSISFVTVVSCWFNFICWMVSCNECSQKMSKRFQTSAHLYTILISKQTYLRPFNTNKDRVKAIKKKLRLWGYSYATDKQIKTSTYDIISSD